MTNGNHTAKKKHGNATPHIYLGDRIGWQWVFRDMLSPNHPVVKYCLKMDKLTNSGFLEARADK